MQTLTPELAAILKAKWQAGTDGFRARVTIAGNDYPVMSLSLGKSLTTDADKLDVVIDNHAAAIAEDDLKPDMQITVHVWYGDEANSIQVFSGLVDRVLLSRHPNVVSVSARDWMKPLIVQKLVVTTPQAANDAAAVRDPSNYVYLNMTVEAIVGDLLDKAGFPGGGSRAIMATGVTVVEFLGTDDEPFASAISRLADIPSFLFFADELGVIHFEPLVDPGSPLYTWRTGEDVLVINLQTDDDKAYTRVRVVGPMTTTEMVPAWTETWQTSALAHPVGAWWDPADSANVRVLDSRTKRIYTMRQSDQALLSSAYLGGSVAYPVGLSGDPGDATSYWMLEVPCWDTGGPVAGRQSGNKIHKFRKSDNAHLLSYAIPNGAWSDLKVGSANMWLTKYTTHELWKFSLVGVPVTGYQLADPDTGALLRNPTGIAIDGTKLETFYAAGKSYVSSTAAVSTITSTVTSSPGMFGGEFDTVTHSDLFVTGTHSVWKYATTTISETSVTVAAEAIDAAFEAELLALSGIPEVRRLRVPMEAVLSVADAQATAELMLLQVNHFGKSLDVGIIGNPAIQKKDKIRIEDPVLGIASDWQVVTYRSDLSGDSGTYLGTLSLKNWAEAAAITCEEFSNVYSGDGSTSVTVSQAYVPGSVTVVYDVDEAFGPPEPPGSDWTHSFSEENPSIGQVGMVLGYPGGVTVRVCYLPA